MGDDLHAIFCRRKTGWQEFRLSFLLDDAETASPKGDEPSIVAESGDSDTS
jgi:hypothetical protein